ncbi:hypothetical protein BH11PLA1_BH11PLA1_15160 [soil metagenome]
MTLAGCAHNAEPSRTATPATALTRSDRVDEGSLVIRWSGGPENGGARGERALSRADLLGLPRTQVSVPQKERGASTRLGGVLVADVLARTGFDFRAANHSRNVRGTVTCIGGDDYSAVFSLGELDPTLGAAPIMIADAADGSAIGPKEGPWRIVVPNEVAKRARWVRNLRMIEVRDAAPLAVPAR